MIQFKESRIRDHIVVEFASASFYPLRAMWYSLNPFWQMVIKILYNENLSCPLSSNGVVHVTFLSQTVFPNLSLTQSSHAKNLTVLFLRVDNSSETPQLIFNESFLYQVNIPNFQPFRSWEMKLTKGGAHICSVQVSGIISLNPLRNGISGERLHLFVLNWF